MERIDEEDNLVGDMRKKGSVILLISIFFFNIIHAWNTQNSYGIEKMFLRTLRIISSKKWRDKSFRF